MREKEKASASSCALASLEDLILVKNRMQRLLQNLWWKIGTSVYFFEQLPGVHYDLYLYIYDLVVCILSLF
jgi:hypothetical protein